MLLESLAFSNLEGLNLEDTWLTNKGAFSLAQALKKNTTLKKINLYKNRIKEEGAKALQKVFEGRLFPQMPIDTVNQVFEF